MNKDHLSIAYVFDGKFAPNQGVSSYISVLGDYFQNLGHEVNYLVAASTSNDPKVFSLGSTTNVRFNGNQIDMPLKTSKHRVDDALTQIQPDLLHIQMPYSPFLGSRVISRAKPGTAIVGTFHIVPNSRLVKTGSRLLSLIDRSSLGRIDQTLSVSTSAQTFARTSFGIESTVIPCPIDLNYFAKAKKLPQYDDKKLNIVFLGRLVERKGAQFLLQAVAALDNSTKARLRVLIGGQGPRSEDIVNQTKKYGLNGVVRFLGYVEEKDKPNLLASADIAVFPSTGGESFGIVLAEAMAAGAGAVIGGNNQGYRDVLGNQPATLFDPTNMLEFSQKITHLVNDPIVRREIHAFQQVAVKKFDVASVGQKVFEIYRRALNPPAII